WTSRYLPRRLYGFEPVAALMEQGAVLVLNVSASPFAAGKLARRIEMLAGLATQHRVPIAYCNVVGGNDQLIFDGNSLAVGSDGKLLAQLPAFEEAVEVVDSDNPKSEIRNPKFLDEPAELFAALSLGLRDYLSKCGFKSVVLGLSGGIDSAVTAVIAAHALGAENVLGVAMPTQFSSR